MPKEWLNLVNVAYLGGAIDKDQVFAAVSLLNVLDIATSGVRDLLGNISASGVGKLNGVIDSLYRDTEEDLFESDGITDQSIYLSFHETAQVLASKQIHLASSKKGWPILEARHLAKEIDIKLDTSLKSSVAILNQASSMRLQCSLQLKTYTKQRVRLTLCQLRLLLQLEFLWVHYCLQYWEMKLLALERCLMRGQQSRV